MVLFSNPNAENTAWNARNYGIGFQSTCDVEIDKHVSMYTVTLSKKIVFENPMDHQKKSVCDGGEILSKVSF